MVGRGAVEQSVLVTAWTICDISSGSARLSASPDNRHRHLPPRLNPVPCVSPSLLSSLPPSLSPSLLLPLASSGLESPSIAGDEVLANDMGLFLQKANIIRDYLVRGPGRGWMEGNHQ